MEDAQKDQDTAITSQETKRTLNARLRKDGYALWEVYIEGGGPAPEALSGSYSSYKKAMNAIESFNNTKQFIFDNKRPYHKGRDYANKNKARN